MSSVGEIGQACPHTQTSQYSLTSLTDSIGLQDNNIVACGDPAPPGLAVRNVSFHRQSIRIVQHGHDIGVHQHIGFTQLLPVVRTGWSQVCQIGRCATIQSKPCSVCSILLIVSSLHIALIFINFNCPILTFPACKTNQNCECVESHQGKLSCVACIESFHLACQLCLLFPEHTAFHLFELCDSFSICFLLLSISCVCAFRV